MGLTNASKISNYLTDEDAPDEAEEAMNLHLGLMVTNEYYKAANIERGLPMLDELAWAETIDFAGIFPPDHYEQFKKLTLQEKFLALTYPVSAFAIRINQDIALAEEKSIFGFNSRNGVGDAFRHAFWLAINTRDVGTTRASEFGTAHESETHPDLLLEKEMDLFNNSVGLEYSFANPNSTNSQLSTGLQNKLLNGDLRFLDPIDYNDPCFNPLVCPNFPKGTGGILPNTQLIPTF